LSEVDFSSDDFTSAEWGIVDDICFECVECGRIYSTDEKNEHEDELYCYLCAQEID
jgi:hypothetical protein